MRDIRPVAILLAAILVSPLARAAGAPNDPLFLLQWGLARIQAPGAWSYATGAGVTIGIVDTGIDDGHPDLIGKLIVPKGVNLFCSHWGCDPDRPWDDHGHGTHVAGIAAASADNGIGVAGVAPGASILPVKILSRAGEAPFEDVAAGIRFAVDHGADVVNLSLGGYPVDKGYPADIALIAEAAQYAWDHGTVLVAAAGNDAIPFCGSPANSMRVLCVGSIDREDLKSWYGNFGTQLAVVAPGGVGMPSANLIPGSGLGLPACDNDAEIFSTYPTVYDRCGRRGYQALSGTSMAVPHVAGVAALLASLGLSNQQIVTCITQTADDLGPPGFDPLFGYGRVNALRAVQTCRQSV